MLTSLPFLLSASLDDLSYMPVERQRYVASAGVSAMAQRANKAFMQLYSQILDHAGPAFGAVLRHIRDKPEQGCLFHCTGTHAIVLARSTCCYGTADRMPNSQLAKTGQASWPHYY